MEFQNEIKIIEKKLMILSNELISLIPEDNEIIKIKKEYYKNLMMALNIIKNQQEDLEKSNIMRYCN